MNKNRYPIQNVIAIDIDGTLIIDNKLNINLINWIKKENGNYTFYLWTSRGKKYADHIADKFKIKDLFDSIISKPGFIVDDKGWKWTHFTKVLKIKTGPFK